MKGLAVDNPRLYSTWQGTECQSVAIPVGMDGGSHMAYKGLGAQESLGVITLGVDLKINAVGRSPGALLRWLAGHADCARNVCLTRQDDDYLTRGWPAVLWVPAGGV